MESKQPVKVKAKRQKKRKSRTEGTRFLPLSIYPTHLIFPVSSSSSSSEAEPSKIKVSKKQNKDSKPVKTISPSINTPPAPKEMSDAEVTAAFTKFYLQRATTEFSEDLDKMRGADDFNAEALPVLINALQQGTSLFGVEEMRRIVTAGEKKPEEG
jgi:ribosome assembly protein 3